MGFSVTVTHAIMFVAFLSAGSAALNAYMDTSRDVQLARVEWSELAAREVHTDLTLTVNQCTSGCNPPTVQVRLDVKNDGTTVVDFRNLTYIIDGRAYTISTVTDYDIVSPSAVSNTDLILPGETMRVELNPVTLSASYNTNTLPVQVATLDGTIGRR